jgi:hypothetical protein
MFSSAHLIFILISLAFTAAGTILSRRYITDINLMLKICLVIGIVSEIIKIFSVADIVPVVTPVVTNSAGGIEFDYRAIGPYTPYIKAEHFPFQLCSIQLILISVALLLKDARKLSSLFALMYATQIIGGILAILLPYLVTEYDSLSSMLISPRVWQYFLYHSMIITLGLYIGNSTEAGIRFEQWKTTALGIMLMDIPSFYLNSIMSEPVYLNGKLVGVSYCVNYFSSYVNPIGLNLTQKWQWLLYLCVRCVLAIICIYSLFLIKRKRAYFNR